MGVDAETLAVYIHLTPDAEWGGYIGGSFCLPLPTEAPHLLSHCPCGSKGTLCRPLGQHTRSMGIYANGRDISSRALPVQTRTGPGVEVWTRMSGSE
jgi:hypothetical protein